jgi:hypothetical protein
MATKYHYYEHRGWRYAYLVHPNEDEERPWAAFVYKPIGKGSRKGDPEQIDLVKVKHFARKKSAANAAERWWKAHMRRDDRYAERKASGYIPPSRLCPKCEAHAKVKGDYLCHNCRFQTEVPV